MNVVRTLWASIQGDPVLMRRVNGWLTVFWLLMIPLSLVTGWISSVTYVAALSLWALVSGHWSAWQAARVEVRQDELVAKELQHAFAIVSLPEIRRRQTQRAPQVTSESLRRRVIQRVRRHGDRHARILEEPGRTDETSHREILLGWREARAKEAAHERGRDDLELTAEKSHRADPGRFVEEHPEKAVAALRRGTEIHLDPCQCHAMDLARFVVQQHRAQLLPPLRLPHVDQGTHTAATENQDRLRGLR